MTGTDMSNVVDLAQVRAQRGLPPVVVPARWVEVGDRVRIIGTRHSGIATAVVWMPERDDFAVDVRVNGISVGTTASRLAYEPEMTRPVVCSTGRGQQ